MWRCFLMGTVAIGVAAPMRWTPRNNCRTDNIKAGHGRTVNAANRHRLLPRIFWRPWRIGRIVVCRRSNFFGGGSTSSGTSSGVTSESGGAARAAASVRLRARSGLTFLVSAADAQGDASAFRPFEREDWRTTAEACGFDFHYLVDGERYLGRTRLLCLHTRGNRKSDRDPDRRNRCDVPRSRRPRGRQRIRAAPPEDSGSVLAADPR